LTIFVSIASYRDPELVPTILDCLTKAKYPDEIRIGVCWQHGPTESIDPVLGNAHIDVLSFDWRDSEGPCWARAQIMKLWDGEDFYLQLDSHHRFVRDWDVKLLGQLQLISSQKPILTTYCQGYDLKDGTPLSRLPTRMDFDTFTPDGIPLFRAVSISPSSDREARPTRSRFVSAHFLFTDSAFVQEVEYDPDLYFYGEEISLAVRAYTWGYDFFHPTEAIVFHQYSRDERVRHWDDHSEGASVAKPWYERDTLSRERVVSMLLNGTVGRFTCGTHRTVEEYQRYAGINFARRIVQKYTRSGEEPPNPIRSQWDSNPWRRVHVTIELERANLPTSALAEADLCLICLTDSEGTTLYEINLQREVLDDIRADTSAMVVVQLSVECSSAPKTWRLSFLDAQGRAIGGTSGSV
jgi:hypothetical protein